MSKIRCILLIALMGAALTAFAQEQKAHFSKEEFRTKQQEYITREAKLTAEEAEQFFPLFFELQEKKHQISRELDKLVKQSKHPEGEQEMDYTAFIDKHIRSRLDLDILEQTYIEKYRSFLSDKTIYRILTAETKFHRHLLKDKNREGGHPGEHKGAPQKRH